MDDVTGRQLHRLTIVVLPRSWSGFFLPNRHGNGYGWFFVSCCLFLVGVEVGNVVVADFTAERGPEGSAANLTKCYGWINRAGRGEMSSKRPLASNDQIDAVLRSEPPMEGATLDGWVAFCEWKKPDGERILLLFGRPEESLLQLKGYVHSGLLNMVWKTYEDPLPPDVTG